MVNIPAKTFSYFIVFVLIRTGQFDALLFYFLSVEMLRQRWVKCRTLKVLSKRNSLKWKRKSSRRTRTLMLVTLVSVWLGLKGGYAVNHFLQNCKRGIFAPLWFSSGVERVYGTAFFISSLFAPSFFCGKIKVFKNTTYMRTSEFWKPKEKYWY